MAALAPGETRICFGSYLSRLSFISLSQIARRNSRIPALAVYRVKLASIASIAAFLIYSGVLKSGSPTPKLTTSIP